MSLKLKYYNDPILRKQCAPVETITQEVRELAQHLISSVLEYDGAGLVAPQVGYSVRMFVIRYSHEVDSEGWPKLCPPTLYINPTISVLGKEKEVQTEGCLSIPNLTAQVERPTAISVEAMDLNGALFSEEARGWRARVILHENDHLNGTLFIDRIDAAQKKKVKRSLEAIHRKFHEKK